MATRESQDLAMNGTAPTYYAASGGGDRFKPGPNRFLHVKNANGSSIDVTLVTPGTQSGLSITDRVVAVANGADKFFPLPVDDYASADEYGDVTWSATSGVTFAILRATP